jgi:alpha-L-fucosidase
VIGFASAVMMGAGVAVQPPTPFGACPSAAQVAWHEMEFYGFIHFTTNTFTDKEWGYGEESPAIFNPTALDAGQWARVARESGMTGLIITAKHHDGFCLWPTKLSEHSVKHSPWRNGKGDVLRELSEACKAAGLRFGVYLSPWDRNHAAYGTPAYVEYYRAQVKELFENYGPIFEFWLDGANGGDGYYAGAREKRTIDRTTYYGWPETHQLILSHNPDAIIFSDAGPGCRWVGNESGYSDETSWQTINLAGMYPGVSHDHLARGDKGGTHWVGVEVDVSIRPGWFYHASEDAKVKSGARLVEIWYESVGRGANLLLNVPPDRRGLIHERDAASLTEMRRVLSGTFANDLAKGATVTATNERAGYGARGAVDEDPATYWAMEDGLTTGTLTLEMAAPATFDVVKVREEIALGQRVESFVVEYEDGGAWKELCKGTTIGPRRVIRTPLVTAQRVRVRITGAMACPVISEIGLYKQAGP